MTDGLVLLGAWAEFLALVGVLLFFVLRRGNDDPAAESHRATPHYVKRGDHPD